MAKKSKAVKEEDEPMLYPDGYIGTIPKDIYWEWRTSCSELNLVKEKLETKRALQRIMQSEVEISKLRCELFANKIKDYQKEIEVFVKELDESRKKIEESIGSPIKGCIINEVFQVIRDDPAPPSLGEAISK